ncbi:DUF6339 family protein [Microvirga yunnanensis]|uniref:DUF6339 family protein n=1 Tax=Microvirga yunnanensis TaxID=2953740 RepID=UPI0021C921D8|nr:DUF6339 family protein [Microvirga sp. HBU65207]
MRETLKLFPDDLTADEIARHVLDISHIRAVPITEKADLSLINDALSSGEDSASRTALDQVLVEPVHRALAHLPRTLLLRPGLWHYLCMERYRDLVWERWWSGLRPGSVAEMLSRPAKIRRFGCRPSMNGMARNALARLFWAGETLRSPDGDYSLARQVFTMQETHQQVFDNTFGLAPGVARAFVAAAQGRNNEEVQRMGKSLNLFGSTIMLDYLDESDVAALLA